MLDNIVIPVERASACATNAMTEIALLSTLKNLKGLPDRTRKIQAYLSLIECVVRAFLNVNHLYCFMY